jgi:hypothetical protein
LPAPAMSQDRPPPLDQSSEALLLKNRGKEWCGINHRRLKIEDRRKNRTTLA